MGRRVLLLVLLAALALAPSARASTVSVLANPDPSYLEARAIYRAAPGERNRVTVTAIESDPDFVVTFRDPGAPVEPGAGCVAKGPHTARCFKPGLNRADLHLRDGDDTLLVRTKRSLYVFRLHAIAGRGADTLTGSPRPDDLQGGPGADTVRGRGGPDALAGGSGRDTLDGGPGEDYLAGEYFNHEAPPAADRITGGRSRGDTIAYYGGRAPVHVDLAQQGGNGAAGENDTLSGIEEAGLLGGTGTVAGNERSNYLWVGRAARGAVLRGRGGNDVLLGGDDPDAIYGGRGSDYLLAGKGMGDRLYAGRGQDILSLGNLYGFGSDWSRAIHCGRGADVVHDSARHDIPSRDCEQASSSVRLGISPDLRRVGGHAIELSLHRRGPHTSCRYAIRLRAPFPQRDDARPREIGRLVFRNDRKKWRRIRIELNEYGRRLLARERPLPVWVQPGELDRCRPGDKLWFGPDGFTALL